jgi:hypothetical protein
MANIKVAIMNASTVVKDADVQAIIPALQTQVQRDFAPLWGIDADLAWVPKGSAPAAGAWWLTVFDNSDQPGALGYHDVTTEGLPLGKVFAGTDIQYGNSWTTTCSHELLEMLADPEINLTVFVQPDDTSGTLYAYEVCDTCEADEFGYKIDGVLLSDFVYPAWFEASRKPKSTQFDYKNVITKPLELLKGGYIGVFDVTAGTGWQQRTPPGARLKAGTRPHVGSRRERRRTPRDRWLVSTVKFKKKK